MSNIKRSLGKLRLKVLSVIAPKIAGQIATKLFTQSRNEANPHKKAFTPAGAKVIPIKNPDSKVKQIYLWGDQGEIVLLVHGWGAECGSMFSFASKLLKQGYRVATFDGPAHGSSDGEYSTMWEYVESTKMVINQLGDVTRVISHSLGGIVATAASAGNKQIKSLTLISTPYSLMDVLNIWSGSFMQLSSRIREEILAQLLIDNGVPVSHWDVGLHGRNWNVPVQVIHDNDDPVVSSTHATRIANALPQAHTRLFNGLGHVRVLSNGEVHNAILEFFNNETSAPQQEQAIAASS